MGLGQRVAKLGAAAALACRFLPGLFGAHFESGRGAFGPPPAVGEGWSRARRRLGREMGRSIAAPATLIKRYAPPPNHLELFKHPPAESNGNYAASLRGVSLPVRRRLIDPGNSATSAAEAMQRRAKQHGLIQRDTATGRKLIRPGCDGATPTRPFAPGREWPAADSRTVAAPATLIKRYAPPRSRRRGLSEHPPAGVGRRMPHLG